MAVKVSFLSGASTVTVSGLHQWDYGQTLEIECTELGSEIVEVHFACTGMSEAIVRPCTFANGVGTVIIPDRCLEQTSNITAWIYKVDSSAGHTIKTVILPVIARTRPGKAHDVPSQYVDKYAEAITAINTAVEALESGNVTVAKAVSADTATTATTANSAKNATYASSAGSASSAGTATYSARVMVSPDYPYCSITLTNGIGTIEKSFTEALYLVVYATDGILLSGVGYIGTNSGSLNAYLVGLGKVTLLYSEVTDGAEVSLIDLTDSSPDISGDGTLTFVRIGEIAQG